MNVKFVCLALICLICFGLAIATASNVNYVEIPIKNITSNEKLNEFFNVTSNGSAILSQNDSQSVIPMSEYIYEKIRKEKENNEENLVHSTIYVPDDYPTIQQAVNASSPGYTIIVRDGVYTENVVVNVEHLTIKSENGYANCIVKAASKEKPVFYIKSDYVNVTGFSITGGSDGVDITSKNCTIAKNNISRVEIYVSGNKLRTILVDNLWRKSKDINIGFPLFPEGGKYRIKAKVFDEYGRMASKEINAEIKDPYEEVKEVSIKSNAIKSLDSEIKPTLTSIFGGVKIRSSSFDYSGIYMQYIAKRPVTIDDVIKLKESFPEYCFMGGSISDNRFTLTFIKHGNSNLCVNGIIGFKYLDIHVS